MRLPALAATLLLIATAPLAACSSDGRDSTHTTSAATEGTGDNSQERMIGYRLKRLDQLIEATFDRLLGNAGLTRRQWQTMNVLSGAPRSDAELVDALRPFWEVNNESLTELTNDLVSRGWVRSSPDGMLTLTSEGSSAHAAADQEVGRIRQIVAKGVSQDEFSLMMDVLQRMTANLEADATGR
ncbi:MarR family transcriptional regulator [Nocardia sp. NPDC050710]|uniref:MarR family winged helix-turn-helix transcriptional regulator n=1 Tax=Nocardia sp. NPDC050710 TaxID=3157220 RepID=UPI0033DA650C